MKKKAAKRVWIASSILIALVAAYGFSRFQTDQQPFAQTPVQGAAGW